MNMFKGMPPQRLKGRRHPLLSVTLALIAACAISIAPPAQSAALPVAEIKREGPVDFESEILPVLKSNCLACHNQTKAKADLILETPQTILKGGSSGTSVVPGKPEESYIFEAAAHLDEDTIMPPKNNKVAASNLSPQELGLLKRWIAEGAKGEVRSAGPIQWQPLPQGVNPIYATAISPDGQYAACGRANQIFVYHIPSKRLVTRLTDPQLMEDGIYGKPGAAHRDLVHALEFSPDGSLLASSGYREVKLWRRPLPSQPVQLATEAPAAVAASADGNWFATAAGNEIALWDSNGKKLNALQSHTAAVTSLAFSPDNTRLLSGSKDKSLKVWDISSAKEQTSISTPAEVTTVTWLAEANQIASGGSDSSIRTWQLPTKPDEPSTQITELKGHTGPITALASTEAAKDNLFSSSQDGSIHHWDTKQSKSVRKLDHGGPVHTLAVRPDGQKLAAAGSNKVITLWNVADGKKIADLTGDIEARNKVVRSTRTQTLAASELDFQKNTLKTAEDTEKKERDRLKKAEEALTKAADDLTKKEKALADANTTKANLEKESEAQKGLIALAKKTLDEADKLAQNAEASLKEAQSMSTPDKAQIEKRTTERDAKKKAAAEAKTAFDNTNKEATAKQTDLANKVKEADKEIAKTDGELKKAQRTRDTSTTEKDLASKSVETSSKSVAQAKDNVKAAEEAKKESETQLAAAKAAATSLEQPVNALAFSRDNHTLYSAGDNQRINTWNADSGAALESLPTENGKLTQIATANNKLIMTGSKGQPAVWDFNAGWKLDRTLGTGDDSSPFVDRVVALGFSQDGTQIVTGGGEPSRSGEILVFNVTDGKLQKTFKQTHSDTVLDVAFSPNGKYIASSAADRFVRVTELASDKTVRAFEGHTHHVLGVSWKADSRTLVSAGADNVLKVWDFVTGERKKNVTGHSKEVTSVNFVGITDQAISTAGDKTVRMFKTDGNSVRSFSGPQDFVYASAITPDGTTVIAGGEDSVLHVWSTSDGKSITTFPAPETN